MASAAGDRAPRPPAGRWRRWLDRRVPPRARTRLHRRNVFIFPPASGFAYLGLIAVLLLGAINYQNALVFAVAFLLASLFVLTIGRTYRNLAGLEVEGAGASEVFAGDDAAVTVVLRRHDRRAVQAIRLGWPAGLPRWVDLLDTTELRVRLPVPTARRGWLDPGRLHLETRWPLGLLRAWSWVDLDQRILVYPRPVFDGAAPAAPAGRGETETVVGPGDEDFLGLRGYRPGDPLNRVAWKSFAREGEVRVKDFGATADRRLWLDWDALTGMDVEARLSRLCGWALAAEAAGDAYGLRLPGVEIEPGRGEAHRTAVLTALARHGGGPVAEVGA